MYRTRGHEHAGASPSALPLMDRQVPWNTSQTGLGSPSLPADAYAEGHAVLWPQTTRATMESRVNKDLIWSFKRHPSLGRHHSRPDSCSVGRPLPATLSGHPPERRGNTGLKRDTLRTATRKLKTLTTPRSLTLSLTFGKPQTTPSGH